MAIIRIYTGPDGQSHFQDVEPESESRGDQSEAAEPILGSGIVMRVRRLGSGDILIAEDLTGQGHVTREVGPEPRVSVFVPLGAPR
jgi:hypothetical protein